MNWFKELGFLPKSCSKWLFGISKSPSFVTVAKPIEKPIIASMSFGKQRFTEMQRKIPKITPRMLSKELKELELNGIVKRMVYDSIPVTVEYELTESAKQLSEVRNSMIHWGINHRN